MSEGTNQYDIAREAEEAAAEREQLLDYNARAKATLAERLKGGGKDLIIEDIVRTAERNEKGNGWFYKFLRKFSKTING